jgi:hypothetical protein
VLLRRSMLLAVVVDAARPRLQEVWGGTFEDDAASAFSVQLWFAYFVLFWLSL